MLVTAIVHFVCVWQNVKTLVPIPSDTTENCTNVSLVCVSLCSIVNHIYIYIYVNLFQNSRRNIFFDWIVAARNPNRHYNGTMTFYHPYIVRGYRNWKYCLTLVCNSYFGCHYGCLYIYIIRIYNKCWFWNLCVHVIEWMWWLCDCKILTS